MKRIWKAWPVALAFVLLAAAAGCGDSKTSGDADAEEETPGDPVMEDLAPAEDVGPEEVEDEDAGGDPADAEIEWQLASISLPQAVDDALWANPDVYESVPLHVAVEGMAQAVQVRLDEDFFDAVDDGGDGDWVAMLPVGDLADGVHEVEATASAPDLDPIRASAELGIGRSGIQLTDFNEVGFAGTPRAHRVGPELWLTWTDRSDELAEAWLRRIDGAGRWMGDRIEIVGSDEETLYARTAVGNGAIAVLYQGHGMPYSNHFRICDFSGSEIMAPMDLDPSGWSGAFGGAVAWDGTGFVAVWRVIDGAGAAEVRWMRVDEAGTEVTGPVVAAASGDGDPIGGFEPFSFVSVAAREGVSLVAFVRSRYEVAIDMEIPKSQITAVLSDGTLEYSEYAGLELDLTWHREARVFILDDVFLCVWSASDLMSPDDFPPNLFYATLTDDEGALDPLRSRGTVMFDQVDDRDEPFFLPHPEHLGILTWIDHRAYTLEPETGGIELYSAPVAEDLTTGEETVFPHARFVAGLSQLNAAPAGTNAILLWVDERHGMGIMDPKPEMYMETAWY
jgi:hypothetical protein